MIEKHGREFFPTTGNIPEMPEANRLFHTKYFIDIITPQHDSIKWVLLKRFCVVRLKHNVTVKAQP